MFKHFYLPLLLTAGVAPLTISGTINEPKANYVFRNTVSSVEFQEFYNLNDVVEIPTLVKGGLAYNATVEFPDGSASKDSSVTLSMVGKYLVHYSARSGERYLSEEYSFMVKNQSFSFSGLNSYASYEKSERNYNKEGLFVALAQHETFTYMRTLDLSNVSENQRILDLFVCPSVIGTLDFSTLIFTFTDVNDPHCKLQVKAVASPDGMQYPWTYWSVKGQNQDVFVGLEGNNIIHAGDPYGHPTSHSFYGYYSSPLSGNCGDYRMNFSYNSTSKCAYANGGLIAELDSKRFFNFLWDGFTTGEVILSIEADNYGSDYAKFNILQIFDTDLSDTIVEDDAAPILTVDVPEGALPKGRVSYEYPLFNASAEDYFSGIVPVKKSVYFVHGTNRIAVTVKNDAFIPTKEGTYIVRYEASDRVGNVASREFEIEVVNRAIPISIFNDDPIPSSVKKGQIVYFPSLSLIGGSGQLNASYSVTHNGLPVEFVNKYFIPRDTGVYTFGVSVIDYIGQTAYKSFNYNVIDNTEVVFYDKPQLPDYFISGYEYDLPALYGTDYGNNGELVLADVDITMNGVTTTQKSDSKFTPTVNSNGDVITITYKSRSEQITKQIPTIINIENRLLQIQRYFDNDGINVDVNHSDYSIISATRSGEVSTTFISPLISELLTFEITPTANSNFQELRFTLTDEFNPDEQVTVRLAKTSDNKIMMHVGNNSNKFDFSFSNTEEMMEFAYFDGAIHLGNSSLDVDRFDNGDEFTGFSSYFIYLSFTMIGASTDSSIALNKICNQPIYSIPFDFSRPLIYYTGETGGYHQLGDIYNVTLALFFDVLIPNVSSTISVFDPNSDIVTSTNGELMSKLRSDREYAFALDKYGIYTVSYVATDGINRLTSGYDVGVSEEYTLELVITSSYKTSIKLGEKIVVPNYKISYNGDMANVSHYVTVRSPEASITLIPEGSNAYKPKYKGNYVVNIYAFDLAGNVALFSYTVTVK